MSRWYIIVALLLIGASSEALADIVGSLRAKVVDASKKPLPGATVRILGTSRGGITKADGVALIGNLPVGPQRVRVTYTGKDTTIIKVTIVADQTSDISVTMTDKVKDGPIIEVTAQREMVTSAKIGSSTTIDESTLTGVALNNTMALVGRQAGVQISGNGLLIRGSRPTESQVMVDGLTVTDQFTGGLGNSGATVSAALPSTYATAQVAVQTGGMSAEYGNALGGSVNTVVKSGKTDRFEALVAWRKDVPFAFGSAANGIQSGAPYEDVADFTLGGPLGIGSSTFFVAVSNTFQNHRNYDLQVFDPEGNNLGLPPNNRTWSRNITGKMNFEPVDGVKLVVGGMFGMVNGERHSWSWLYANEQGQLTDQSGRAILDANGNVQFNGVPTRNAQQIVVQEFTSNAYAQVNHVVNEATFYDFKVSVNGKTTETAKRQGYDAPSIFGGFDLRYPEDRMVVSDTNYILGGSNQILDAYDFLRATRRSSDGYANIEVTVPNPITGYIEGPPDAFSTDNPYGLISYFNERGNEGGVDLRNAQFYQFDGKVQHNIRVGETEHQLRAGFELRFNRLSRHFNANPWDGSPFYDVYGSDYGPNPYITVDPLRPYTEVAKRESENPYRPVTGAFFVQDQIFFKKLVFTPGVRIDYLNTDALYRTNFDRFYEFGRSEGFAQVDPKLYISPRLNVTYPITERQNFRLSYGIYYMAPPFAEIYDSFNSILLRGQQTLGNPNLEMQRNNSYEIAYNHQLTDDLAVTATGFYKDIYNQSGLAFVRITPVPYFQRVLSDYGTSRGIELTLDKLVTNNWGFNINYTLMDARGTANTANAAAAIDPITQNPAFPVTEFPLGFDRRHRINGNVTVAWGREEGPTIAGVHFLENLNITLSAFWQSGLPYTPLDGRGQFAGEINTARQPSNWNSEMRIVRTISLAGVFGGATELDLFLDVFNVFNNTQAFFLFPRTGSPDFDGLALNRVPGDFPSQPYFREGDVTRKETFAASQYDRAGKRLYNQRVDFNNDGIVTQDETFRGYQQYVNDVVAQQFNYIAPRQVFFGVRVRFN
jgi:outer membrane receptor protein involved in Fe transport